MKSLLPALGAAVLLSACAHKNPEHVRGPASESRNILVEHHYVPVRQIDEQLWGEHRFVPGYARQGVIVTPSRTWTYGQGEGFRTPDSVSMDSMTGNQESRRYSSGHDLVASERGTGQQATKTIAPRARPCVEPPYMSRKQELSLGRAFSHMGASQIKNAPFNEAEKKLFKLYSESNCMSEGQVMERLMSERQRAVAFARNTQASEKGGVWTRDDPDPLPPYELPPESAKVKKEEKKPAPSVDPEKPKAEEQQSLVAPTKGGATEKAAPAEVKGVVAKRPEKKIEAVPEAIAPVAKTVSMQKKEEGSESSVMSKEKAKNLLRMKGKKEASES